MEQTECSETSAYKIQTPGTTQKKAYNTQLLLWILCTSSFPLCYRYMSALMTANLYYCWWLIYLRFLEWCFKPGCICRLVDFDAATNEIFLFFFTLNFELALLLTTLTTAWAVCVNWEDKEPASRGNVASTVDSLIYNPMYAILHMNPQANVLLEEIYFW